jgi:hypothetical protein
MVSLSALWLPIVLSAIAVFFLSFLMWMVLPHHRADYKRLPDEDALVRELEKQGARPGMYGFPHCANPAQMRDPDWVERFTKHPAGTITLKPEGGMNMGKSMLVSLLFNLLISTVVAYVTGRCLGPDAGGSQIAQVTTVIAWLAYGGALGWRPIWYFESWGVAVRGIIDALVYGAATGLLFMAFWPSGSPV